MTAYEEISRCARANREFWTGQARFFLCMYRSHRGKDEREAKWQRANFRKNMQYRRELRFFGDD